MKKRWWIWLLVLLPGGLVLAALGFSLDLYASLATGNANADALLWPMIYGLLKVNTPMTPAAFADTLNQGRALMLVLLAENSFNPTANYPGPVGDLGDARGPSISPWQILRTSAIAGGYVDASTTSDQYAQIDTLDDLYTWASNAADWMQKQVWPLANGDIHTALEIWNGGPQGANVSASQTYASNAIAGISPAAPGGAPAAWGVT
jgi:hypothetical protein